LPFVGGIARLNRGPIMIGKSKSSKLLLDQLITIIAIRRYASQKKWWILQVAPEIDQSDIACKKLQMSGGKWLSKRSNWASGRLNLENDESVLLMQLKGKWRGHLRKGQKSGIEVTSADVNTETIEILLQNYDKLQENREFVGISNSIIRSLTEQKKDNSWSFNIYFANQNNSLDSSPIIGSLVTINAGDTCTYLIGTTNEIGRKLQANSVLLWEAIIDSKKHNCRWFDIGGLSEETPKGIAEFKKGLNAIAYKLVGEWLFLPKIALKK
jgi:lipid II:glycine glycyltransferase (peptidoglycan interpeptide bridge formation enzyme)